MPFNLDLYETKLNEAVEKYRGMDTDYAAKMVGIEIQAFTIVTCEEGIIKMHTDDELIQRALEIREDIDAMKKTHGEELEPYEMALQDIENSLLGRMVERGAKSVGTIHGTAYQSHQLRVKVADRSAFLQFVFEKKLPEFLTNHVSKEQVKEYMEINDGLAPPGVETTTFVQCNIRKA